MFSVVIPVYNRPKELDRALSSLSKQLFKEFEVVICDDGSTVDISYVVDKFSTILNIKVIRIQNSGGPARPRNTAVRHCSYEWIAFLDSDDWWHVDKLQDVFNLINSGLKVDVIHHRLKVVTDSEQPVSLRERLFYSHVGSDLGNASLLSLATQGNGVALSSSVVRRDLFIKLSGMNESHDMAAYEDYDFWCKCAIHGASFRFIGRILGYYAISEDAIRLSPRAISRFNFFCNVNSFEGYEFSSKAISYQKYVRGVMLEACGNNQKKALSQFWLAHDLQGAQLNIKRIVYIIYLLFQIGRNKW